VLEYLPVPTIANIMDDASNKGEGTLMGGEEVSSIDAEGDDDDDDSVGDDWLTGCVGSVDKVDTEDCSDVESSSSEGVENKTFPRPDTAVAELPPNTVGFPGNFLMLFIMQLFCVVNACA
jgi:hypothetical protein